MKNKPYSNILLVLLLCFCFRVAVQGIQYFFSIGFLPSFSLWHSGTLSYPVLVLFQLIIIIFFAWISYQVSSDKLTPSNIVGKRLIVLASIYGFVMIVRYIIKMSLYPTERWFGGSLPILFHIVLASFLLTLGIFHVKNWNNKAKSGNVSRLIWNTVYGLFFLLIPVWILFQLMPSLLAYKMGMRSSEYYVTDMKQVPIKMDDGEVLYADIYRPERLTTAPTILVRIPLDYDLKGKLLSNLVGRIWAERGYNVVIQGVRGRYNSNAKHTPFLSERADGIATLKWMNTQSWHNGKTGMWGGSYFGYTQWAISDQDSLGLQAMLTHISSSNNYNMFYPGGCFAYESALFWATRSYSDKDTPFDNEVLQKGYSKGPVLEADSRVVTDIPFYNDWVTHNSFDDYWGKVDGTERAKNIKAPVLMMAGWFDPFLPSQVQDFEDISKSADPKIAQECKLIIGPWAHAETVKMPNGFVDQNYRFSSIAPSLEWYDKHLSNVAIEKSAPIKLFVMGINQWRYEESFPLERTKYTSWFLGKDTANAKKAYSIDTIPCSKLKVYNYQSDPANPVPSIGGAVLGARAGMKIQNPLINRNDLLYFESEDLVEDIEVTGKVKLILYVSTDAVGTDFMAKLVDVFPNGDLYNVSEGAVRRTYNGKEQIEKIEIELSPMSNVFLTGHKIGLIISSSSYPRFSLNYNTGSNNYDEKEGVIANQKVFTGAEFQSQLILPIIPQQKDKNGNRF